MRKSSVVNRSSLPSGASSRQSTSLGRCSGGDSSRAHGGVGNAEQVPEEVLVALARRAEQVRAPERQHAREVGGVVGVLGRRSAAGPLAARRRRARPAPCPRPRASSARSSGLRSKRRVGRQPAEPRGERVAVGDVLAAERARCPAGEVNSSAPKRLVAPLVGGQVPERGRRLLARRPRSSRARRRPSTSR